MRPHIVKLVFLKEVREILRDRRSLAIMFGIPLLYPLLALVMFGMGSGRQKELTENPARVVVVNAPAAPHLVGQLSDKDSGIQVAEGQPDPVKALKEGKIDAVLEFPPGYEQSVVAGDKAELKLTYDRSRTTAAFAENKISKLLDAYENWVIEQRLARHGVSPKVLEPLARRTTDAASADQRLGHLMGTMLPILLLVTGMLGALFPAFSATTTERELGTLETLLVTPATRMELLVAKGIPVLISGLLTAGLNLASMALVLWRTFSSFEGKLGPMSLSAGPIVLAYLAVIPSLIFFTALVLIAGMMARNFREANAFATPLMLLPISCIVVMIGEPRPTPALLITPVINTALIINEVLTGRSAAMGFVLAFSSSLVYAAVLLGIAVRLFSNEQLVNPSWEPLSLQLFTRRTSGKPRKLRLPAPDEALGIFAVSLLLLFYVQPSLVKLGLLPILTITEVFLVAAPALVAAWVFRYKPVETFSLRRPSVGEMVGAALAALGLSVWVGLLHWAQSKVWPANPETGRAMQELFGPALERHPVLTPVVIGVLAGVCEEILYRGPIQAGLMRRTPAWFGLGLTALLFAGAHLDAQGLPLRFILGLILGWIVWRGGSIFPAMLLHGVYDASQVGLAVVLEYWPHAGAYLGVDPKTGAPQASVATVVRLTVGLAVLLAGWWLMARAWRKRDGDRPGGEPRPQGAFPVVPSGALGTQASTDGR